VCVCRVHTLAQFLRARAATTPTSSGFRPGLRRAATLARRKDKDKEARSDGDMRACDVRALHTPARLY
jgi:hypothetical protein